MSLDHDGIIVKHQTPSRDAFLGGRLHIGQPARGFRAGLDSVLLGASVSRSKGQLLDLGAGVGTAALVALAHAPGLVATLVENDPDILVLATGNIAANGFMERAATLCLDVTSPGAERVASGLPADYFAAVIANPPFFAAGRGTLAKGASRAAARHMDAKTLDLWVRTAAASAAPAGEVVFIHAADSLGPLLAAFEARFGAITVLPLAPRPEAAASRILIRGIKGSRAPLRLLATRSLHGMEGEAFAPEIEAILRGATRLRW